MALVLNGSTGITSPGGDTSTSLSTGLLTVTGSTVPANGMYLPTTNTLAWATNSTRNMTLDASGNLGIGTTSPGGKLDVQGGNSYLNGLRINGSDTANTIYQNAAIGISSGNYIAFSTNSAGPYERARIDSSGNLLVGQTAGSQSVQGIILNPYGTGRFITNGGADNVCMYLNRIASDGSIEVFQRNSTTVGSISVTTSATTYNTSSDQRLKENIVDAPGALSSINAVKVRSFDWKADGSHVDYGYIAQELLEIAPEAVSVPADPEEMMGVDFGKLTPRIIKAIQELTARLEALEGAN